MTNKLSLLKLLKENEEVQNSGIVETSTKSLDPKMLQNLYELISSAYAHVGGHEGVQNIFAIMKYDYVFMADTDQDGKPNVAFLAVKTRNGSMKIGVFASDGAPNTKFKFLKYVKEILLRPNWWAELPKEYASFLHSRGIPMIEDPLTVQLLLGKRTKNSFKWSGNEEKLKGGGYYSRSYFGTNPQTRAIVGNITPELVNKIKQFNGISE